MIWALTKSVDQTELPLDRSRLLDAIDTLPISISVWDKELRLVDCNEDYRRLNRDIEHLLIKGVPFEDVIRARAFSGIQPKAIGREEEWIANRIKAMKNDTDDYQFYVDNEWYNVIQVRLENGDIVNYQKNITAEKKQEIELAESEALYRGLFELCHDAIFIHDGETILFANPATLDLFNVSSIDDLVGRSAYDHVAPEYKGALQQRAKHTITTGFPMPRQEREYIRADGARVGIESHGARVTFGGKKAVLVFARDISDRLKLQKEVEAARENLESTVEERTRNLTIEIEERRTVEEALRKSEGRFRDVAESTSEWIWETNSEHKFTYMSDRAYEIYGWNNGIALGKSRLELLANGNWSVDRNALEQQQQQMDRQEEFKDVEISIILKDGKRLVTTISGKPVYDRNNEFTGYRGTAADITERKMIENALRESENRARVFLNATTDAALLLDSDAVILDMNDAALKMYKKSREKLIGEILFNIIQDIEGVSVDFLELMRDRFRNWVKSREVGSCVDEVGLRWFETNCFPLVDEGGKNTQFAIFVKDITQQKQIEFALRKARDEADMANRSKSDFLANMSHELRSPLTAILGFTESIQEEIFGPLNHPKYREYIDNVHKSGSHLHQLINDLLDVSSIEAGKMEIMNTPVDVSDLATASIRMVKPRAEKAGLKIECDIPSNLPDILGDERRLKQVLVNLIANAVKFTPENGTITFRAKLEQDYLLMSVSDDGIGMDEEGVEQAKSKFGQVESNLARRYEGTGLGLPLSIGLVEMHDGTLNIESALNVGTTVEIRLPEQRIIKP